MTADRRANPRAALAVPLRLEWSGKPVDGESISVNDRGGMISCKTRIAPGQRVLLTQSFTGHSTLARVVSTSHDAVRARGFRLAVRLELHDGEDFWGPLYRSVRRGRSG